ncbi:unnamed protein product, partial [Gulo gulo]
GQRGPRPLNCVVLAVALQARAVEAQSSPRCTAMLEPLEGDRTSDLAVSGAIVRWQDRLAVESAWFPNSEWTPETV